MGRAKRAKAGAKPKPRVARTARLEARTKRQNTHTARSARPAKPKIKKTKARARPAKRASRSAPHTARNARRVTRGRAPPVGDAVVDDAIGRIGQGGEAQQPAPRPEIPRVLDFSILKNYPRERQFIIRKPMQKSLVESLKAVLGKR